MAFIDLNRVRYIKDRKHCWLVINSEGQTIFTSEPNEKKEAVKNALSLANRAYEAGKKEGFKKGAAHVKATVLSELMPG